MPVTWIVLAGFIYYFWNWKIALASIPISFLCGYVGLRTLEELFDMRGWFKAIWLFFRKRDLFLDLLRERRTLHRDLKKVKQ